MTSANLSLADRIKNHRTYINRTLWTCYVALPFLAAYYILGVIMVISRSINYAVIYNQSDAVLAREKIAGAARILGFSQLGWILVIGIAIMFALQGFSYVFNPSQIDFYLSQPTTRTQRIRRNYVNAISTFFILYMCAQIVALIIAAAMGGVNRYVVLSVVVESFRSLNLFFAFYNITVLAVMLSGTLPMAILLTIGFSFISIIAVGELDLFKSIFFATYSDIKPFNVVLSPLFDRLITMMENPSRSDVFTSVQDMEGFFKCLVKVIPREIDILIVALIAFAAVLIFSRIRKTEWAGKSIPLRPFRWFVKIIACMLVGIGSGYLVYIMYIGVWNKRLYPLMCILMLLATIFAGCVMEVILEGNIKRFFKGMAQTIVAACLVLLAFVIYRGDLLGYDSYVPEASRVESCAILGGNRSFNFYNFAEYNSEYNEEMVLTDVEDVIEIARAGMKYKKESADSENSMAKGYYLDILYRMKDGRKIYRKILVPYDSYDEQLDRIVSGSEFKRGYFDCFRDDVIRQADEAAEYHTLRYSALGNSSDTKDFDYARVSDAYRKDLLENYSFNYVKNRMPIGTVEYENNGSQYIYGSLDVYDNFENTIALLKEYGIFFDSQLKTQDIKEIKVTNYYVGYDLEKDLQEHPEIMYEETESASKSYTDQESIEKIIAVSYSGGYPNPWFNYDRVNEQFGIEIFMNGNQSHYNDLYFSFYKGKVPDFVKEDTKGKTE